MIDFIKYRKIYFLLSALVIVPGVYSLLRWGLKPSIDFTGGTLWEISFSSGQVPADKVREVVSSKEVNVNSLQAVGENHYLLRLPQVEETKHQEILQALKDTFKDRPVSEIRFETVGPVLGAELLQKTILGIVLAAVAILFYVAYQFHDRLYGVSAILGMFHDSLVLLGVFSLLGHFRGVEVNTLFVTAILTTLSLSVHDTVVVYDRIRELARRFPRSTFEDLVDLAMNETIVRSLNNSVTIILMLVALVLLGGETIRWFAVALLVGTISGTYSSTFLAAPILVVWRQVSSNIKNKK